MDATGSRRTRDRARQTWSAGPRQGRFARFLGSLTLSGPVTERMPSSGPAISSRRRAASFDTSRSGPQVPIGSLRQDGSPPTRPVACDRGRDHPGDVGNPRIQSLPSRGHSHEILEALDSAG
jgi:hypothetical protein